MNSCGNPPKVACPPERFLRAVRMLKELVKLHAPVLVQEIASNRQVAITAGVRLAQDTLDFIQITLN